ncbi:MAG TPA: HWE histidine kinase domain-containing protein [Caulobacteraceae bacterium]|jgi:two-component sensor histidine kinase|nr:HWE histidine kinase domain-containing protein [Caulobacteraceae bacterium]
MPDFRAVFEASPQPLLLVAADPPRYTMLAVNLAHALAFATTPQALTGLGVLEVFGPDPEPEAAEFRDAIQASFESVLATKAANQMAVRPYAVQTAEGVTVERYWSAINSPMLGPDGAVTHIVSAVQDVTGEVLERRSEEARLLLMREVDHRARNALTIVQSMVRLTTASSLDSFRDVLDGRVATLARAQTSLAARRWEGAWLSEVIEAELSSLAEPARYSIAGPQVLLPAEHVQAVSMVVHELATNAAKYGALAVSAGTLSVGWRRESAGQVVVSWVECGLEDLAAPQSQGFGAHLISQLSRQLGGSITYAWLPTGLTAELSIALSQAPASSST